MGGYTLCVPDIGKPLLLLDIHIYLFLEDYSQYFDVYIFARCRTKFPV